MKHNFSPMAPRWALALLAAAACSGTFAVDEISGDATKLSSSAPKLNAAGTAWGDFNIAQGVPSASKSIQVFFNTTDPLDYPLKGNAATVSLRPSTAGAAVNCSFSATVPVLSPTNAGTCTFRVSASGTNVEIYYLGLLAKNENIRYTISGLQPAVGAHTQKAFDSDTVLPGTPPSPTLARKPARLVLVFDKSGSMDWSAKPADASCGPLYTPVAACRRWNILQSAATQLVNVAKAYAIPGDQLGVVFFDSTASNTGGIAAMTPVTLGAVSGAIASRGPGGSTSIGAGVENLKAGLIASNSNFNNMTLLFTDGEQNTAPFLVSDGAQLLINATVDQPFGTAWAPSPNQIGLCTFRLRPDDPAGPGGTTTLQEIANRGCAGLMNSSATLDALAPDLIQFFLQVLSATLIGDKLELLASIQGQQAGSTGAPPPVVLPFKTSKQDLAFTLLLNWDSEFQSQGTPDLTLTKDGVSFSPLQDPAFVVDQGIDHVSLTLRAPFCNATKKCVKPDGDWSLTVKPGSIILLAAKPKAKPAAAATTPGAGHYGLFVMSDNASLASSYAVTQATKGVGQPLQLTATLAEGGKPLTGLAAGAVRAFVSAPGAGLGNVLSASPTAPGAPAPVDPFSAAGRKVQAMLADPVERAKLLAALALGAGTGIPLAETSPGVYSAPFPATLSEGVYRVSFRVAGSSAGNGDFMRLYNTDHYVPVMPDPAATAKSLVRTALPPCRFAGGCFTLTLKPVDGAGNLVGPGKVGIIFAPPFNGEFTSPTVDNLDGTYTASVGYNAEGAKPPVITVGGVGITLPDSAGANPSLWQRLLAYGWWWLLLLMLIAIVLILWLMRKSGP